MSAAERKPGDFGQITEQLRRATVRIVDDEGDGERGSGSGVIWDSTGLIVTNAHVVRRSRPRIELWDGRAFTSVVESRDDRRDLAALRIHTTGLRPALVGDSSRLRAGEMVVAVGNPLGFIGALTTGVVHAVGPLRGLGRRAWVQATVRLAPGNSGGPLADSAGRVVGLNTMIVSGGLALAAPSNTVAEFLKHGAAVKLGVTVRPVRTRGAGRFGLLVLEIARDTPAEAASLLPGDILIGANGSSFAGLEDLGDAIDSASGGLLTLEFLRGNNASREVHVQLQQPRSAAA